MQISTNLGNSVCAQFEEEGVVCPPKLRQSLFTTGNVDNIDHNTMGNPFTEDTADLIVLDAKDVMPERVVEAVKTAKMNGESQYATYVEERLNKCSKALTDTIKRNKLPLFGTTENTNPIARTQIAALKNDCNLFA